MNRKEDLEAAGTSFQSMMVLINRPGHERERERERKRFDKSRLLYQVKTPLLADPISTGLLIPRCF
jgi:hypothetical protein